MSHIEFLRFYNYAISTEYAPNSGPQDPSRLNFSRCGIITHITQKDFFGWKISFGVAESGETLSLDIDKSSAKYLELHEGRFKEKLTE